MGQAEAILTSPPYADSVSRDSGGVTEGPGATSCHDPRKGGRRQTQGGCSSLPDYGTAEGQLGAMKSGPYPGGEAGVGDVETVEWAGVYKDSWKGLIVPEAFAHPAKVARGLAVRLFDHGFDRGWWRKGDLVADPFCGICGFGIIAAYKGLRFVGVEIEPKFHTLSMENVALHRRRWEAGGDAPPVCLLGDSREFAKLVGGVTKLLALWEVHRAGGGAARLGDFGAWVRSVLADVDAAGAPAAGAAGLVAGAAACVTSPPYADTGSHGNMTTGAVDCNSWTDGRPRKMGPSMNAEGYGTAPGQLGALPPGDADSVITSPPYADVQETRSPAAAEARRERCRKHRAGIGRDADSPASLPQGTYGTTPGQLGALPQGDADGVLTSPPYAASVHGRNGIDLAKCDRPGAHTQAGAQGYGEAEGNVGNLAAGDADSVVTSPPYEGTSLDLSPGAKVINHPAPAGSVRKYRRKAPCQEYGTAPGQVGALRQETYWDAVRCIYGQCFLALKPSGIMAVVVKSFVRKGAVVDLPGQTWRLLLSLGFTPEQRIRCLLSEETREPSLFGGCEVRKRERKSFFRRLHERKFPGISIDFEEVLVVRRPYNEGVAPRDALTSGGRAEPLSEVQP